MKTVYCGILLNVDVFTCVVYYVSPALDVFVKFSAGESMGSQRTTESKLFWKWNKLTTKNGSWCKKKFQEAGGGKLKLVGTSIQWE